MTIKEKIASLQHIDVIKAKINKDVMYFKTNNPDVVVKVKINWEKISVSERIARRKELIAEKNLINDEQLYIEEMNKQVSDIQKQIDSIDEDYKKW